MKILIVDDDITTVDVICNSMKWENFYIQQVERAYNIASAKAILEKNHIDIVICDIEMPMGTGIELLKWIREHNMNCEFLFLTCHEDFRYATTAIEYEAAGYLVKPFNIVRMELELLRVVKKIKDKEQMLKDVGYGTWAKKNKEKLICEFWRSLLFHDISSDLESIRKEIRKRKLNIDENAEYRIIGIKVDLSTDVLEEMGCELLEFACERLICEIMENTLVNESVLKYVIQKELFFVVVDSTKKTEGKLLEDGSRLIRIGEKNLKCQFTCCIGENCEIERAAPYAEEIFEKVSKNIQFSGKCFLEKEIQEVVSENEKLLDLKQLEELLLKHEKMQILNVVREKLDYMVEQNRVNADILFSLKQEILQLLYVYLYRNGVQATELFSDNQSLKIQLKATESVFDMIKWVNYAVARTLDYEQEIKRTFSVVEKVENYIHDHYKENITREHIADSLFMTPEYLAKLYKRKTGRTIKDYINQYRIEQAKKLLQNGEQNIGDVAGDVGFENFSYFSTVFKKYEGISPGEYRKDKS